ncbi:unnamed protein product, partial [Polarella glacialis]
ELPGLILPLWRSGCCNKRSSDGTSMSSAKRIKGPGQGGSNSGSGPDNSDNSSKSGDEISVTHNDNDNNNDNNNDNDYNSNHSNNNNNAINSANNNHHNNHNNNDNNYDSNNNNDDNDDSAKSVAGFLAQLLAATPASSLRGSALVDVVLGALLPAQAVGLPPLAMYVAAVGLWRAWEVKELCGITGRDSIVAVKCNLPEVRGAGKQNTELRTLLARTLVEGGSSEEVGFAWAFVAQGALFAAFGEATQRAGGLRLLATAGLPRGASTWAAVLRRPTRPEVRSFQVLSLAAACLSESDPLQLAQSRGSGLQQLMIACADQIRGEVNRCHSDPGWLARLRDASCLAVVALLSCE